MIEPHGPERHDLAFALGVVVGELLQLLFVLLERLFAVTARELGDEVEGVGLERLFEVPERDLPVLTSAGGVLLLDAVGLLGIQTHRDGLFAGQLDDALACAGVELALERGLVVAAHTVADVGRTGGEDAVLVDELLVVLASLDDLASDVVPDRQVRLRLEDDLEIGDLRRRVVVGAQVDDAIVAALDALVGDARPQHRMHLRHVRAPGHDGVGELDVVVAARRLVDAEGLNEPGHRRRHAVARVGIEVVAAPAGLDHLGGDVALLDGVLPGAHDRDASRTELLVVTLELRRHLVERPLPGDLDEVALLVERAVLHAQQRLGQPVLAIEDLRVVVALGTQQAAVDRRVRIAFDRNDAPGLRGDLDAASDAAESTGALVPRPALLVVDAALRAGSANRNANGHGRRCSDAGLDEISTRLLHGHSHSCSDSSSPST